jgi:DNA-directed RNA polymerase subunit RPC12/RpoP
MTIQIDSIDELKQMAGPEVIALNAKKLGEVKETPLTPPAALEHMRCRKCGKEFETGALMLVGKASPIEGLHNTFHAEKTVYLCHPCFHTFALWVSSTIDVKTKDSLMHDLNQAVVNQTVLHQFMSLFEPLP